jgi:hypothetical protein
MVSQEGKSEAEGVEDVIELGGGLKGYQTNWRRSSSGYLGAH